MHEASVMKSSENEEDSYWQNQKIGMKRFLPGNSLSYVFLPNHMLFPISTVLSGIVASPCTVHSYAKSNTSPLMI